MLLEFGSSSWSLLNVYAKFPAIRDVVGMSSVYVYDVADTSILRQIESMEFDFNL